MTNIIERLRDCNRYGAYQQGPAGVLMGEAADEIERLREEGTVELAKAMLEIERLTAERANRYWEGRYRDEKADNERLRKALQEIAALSVPDYRATEIARRALENKP
jgi:hypothetical protein